MFSSITAEPARKKIRTRSNTDYFLIGKSKSRISGGKLPTLGQVLRFMLHLKEMPSKTSLLSIQISAVVDQALPFWKMAGLKQLLTVLQKSVEKRILKLG